MTNHFYVKYPKWASLVMISKEINYEINNKTFNSLGKGITVAHLNSNKNADLMVGTLTSTSTIYLIIDVLLYVVGFMVGC